jgi:hypothetical protein
MVRIESVLGGGGERIVGPGSEALRIPYFIQFTCSTGPSAKQTDEASSLSRSSARNGDNNGKDKRGPPVGNTTTPKRTIEFSESEQKGIN